MEARNAKMKGQLHESSSVFAPSGAKGASRAGKPKVMAIAGSREASMSMQITAHAHTQKALRAGWRIATSGADGISKTAIDSALFNGNGDQLDIYLPKNSIYSGAAKSTIEDARKAGARIIECPAGATSTAEMIKNSHAAVIVQNNNTTESTEALKKAIAQKLPVKKISYSGGVFSSISKINIAGAALSVIGTLLDLEETQGYFKKREELMEKWRQGKATPEDIEELENLGVQLYTDAGEPIDADKVAIDEDRATYVSNSLGRGNPYHDGTGRFCAADSAAITVYG